MSNENSIEVQREATSEHNFVFWVHVFITALAWLGPFLFSWYLLVAVFLIVLVQFMIWDRCLLNGSHDLEDKEETTLYSYVIEKLGYDVDRTELRLWVREYFYVLLSAIAIIWQAVLGFEPLLFF